MSMSWFRRDPALPPPAPRLDFHTMKLEESMGQFVRSEFAPKPHPRDLDVEKVASLFVDGLEIALAVLDWEERAGQPIAALIEHIKAERELRKSVEAKANGGPKSEEPAS